MSAVGEAGLADDADAGAPALGPSGIAPARRRVTTEEQGRRDDAHVHLTRSSLLARNVALNLLGAAVPALLGLLAIPALVRALGVERFGLLALAWTLIGQFGLLDLGVGRALTQVIAERLGRGEARAVPGLVHAGLAVMLAVGAVAGAALALAAPWLARHALNVSPALLDEAVQALRWLGVVVPVVVVSTGCRSVLEALQRFDWISALRLPLGIATFAVPLLTSRATPSLAAALAALAAVRLVLLGLHGVALVRALPSLARPTRGLRAAARPLVRYGGWMTVSNLVNPLLVSGDRYLIGALVSVTALTYYVTPHEAATKLWLFTSGVLPVLFPAIAATHESAPGRAAALYDRAMRLTFCCLLPATVLGVAFAPELLRVWLGADFAARSAPVLRILLVGVFVNTVGQAAYTLVQAVRRPDVTSALHLVQLPIFALALAWTLPRHGVVGAALVWSVRVVVDAGASLVAAGILLPAAAAPTRRMATWLLAAVLLCAGAALPAALDARLLGAALALPLLGAALWRVMLTPAERERLRARVRAAG